MPNPYCLFFLWVINVERVSQAGARRACRGMAAGGAAGSVETDALYFTLMCQTLWRRMAVPAARSAGS